MSLPIPQATIDVEFIALIEIPPLGQRDNSLVPSCSTDIDVQTHPKYKEAKEDFQRRFQADEMEANGTSNSDLISFIRRRRASQRPHPRVEREEILSSLSPEI